MKKKSDDEFIEKIKKRALAVQNGDLGMYEPGLAVEYYLNDKKRWENSNGPLAVALREVKKYKGFTLFNRIHVYWKGK